MDCRIATALKLAPALLVVPVFQSVFIVTGTVLLVPARSELHSHLGRNAQHISTRFAAIIGGAALFNEMSHLSASSLATFIFGLVLMLLVRHLILKISYLCVLECVFVHEPYPATFVTPGHIYSCCS